MGELTLSIIIALVLIVVLAVALHLLKKYFKS